MLKLKLCVASFFCGMFSWYTKIYCCCCVFEEPEEACMDIDRVNSNEVSTYDVGHQVHKFCIYLLKSRSNDIVATTVFSMI